MAEPEPEMEPEPEPEPEMEPEMEPDAPEEAAPALADGLTVEELEAVCAAALSDVVDVVESGGQSKAEWWASSDARLADAKLNPVPMTAQEREDLARLTAYWRKVKWGAQQGMLKMANERLANAGAYSMRVTRDVVRKLAFELLYAKLDAWMYYTYQRRAKAHTLKRARRILQRSAIKAIAASWHEWTVGKRVMRSVLGRAVARLSFNLLGRSFRGWIDQHVTQGRRATAVDEARRKILMARVIAVFNAWKGFSRRNHLRQFRIRCSLTRVHRHLKRNVCQAWTEVALAEAAEKRAAAEAEAARVVAEEEAARVAAEAAAAEEARATRIITEVRARAQARGLRGGLIAFDQNSYVAPRKRSRLARGLQLLRRGLLQWALAWMRQYATRRARRAVRLSHAKTLMRHSTMRRYLYRFAATPARLRAEDVLAKEKADRAAALEAAEAEVMRLGIDNRRLQRKQRIMEESGVTPPEGDESEGGGSGKGAAAGVPGLKIPPRTPRSSVGFSPRSARSGAGGGGGTPRSARDSVRSSAAGSVRSSRSAHTNRSSARGSGGTQQSERASGLEAELGRLNRKLGRMAEREGHILQMLEEHYAEENDDDEGLLVTPRGNNLQTKAAAAVSRGEEAAEREAAATAELHLGRDAETRPLPGRHSRQQATADLPAGFAPWTGRDGSRQQPATDSSSSHSYYASRTARSRTQQLVRYPASFNELVKVLHKKPLQAGGGGGGVGMQVRKRHFCDAINAILY
jgi:hypothetical protein